MGLDETSALTIRRAQEDQPGEACMVDQERGHRFGAGIHFRDRAAVDLARKTLRRSLRQTMWHPYRGAAVAETLLTAHADLVRTRAPQVGYSARILYQELQASCGYTGSYETVKRWPLRENGEPKYLMGLVAGRGFEPLTFGL